MKISSDGVALIRQFEGLRTKAYKDAVGVWTIGYGHTSAAGLPAVRPGLEITEREAVEILARDLGKYEAAVLKAVAPRGPLQNQFDAMVSLCFNIGPGNFAKSSIARHFQSGNDAKAANAFLLFVKAGGRTLKGLERRREAERALFLKAGKPVKAVPAPEPAKTPEPEKTRPAQTSGKAGAPSAVVIGGAAASGWLASGGYDWRIIAAIGLGAVGLAVLVHFLPKRKTP